jgi:hypothetical protein
MIDMVRSNNYTTVVIQVPQMHSAKSNNHIGFALDFLNYKKECTRLAAASEKAYQLLAHGRWFSPGILRLLPPLKLIAMI